MDNYIIKLNDINVVIIWWNTWDWNEAKNKWSQNYKRACKIISTIGKRFFHLLYLFFLNFLSLEALSILRIQYFTSIRMYVFYNCVWIHNPKLRQHQTILSRSDIGWILNWSNSQKRKFRLIVIVDGKIKANFRWIF